MKDKSLLVVFSILVTFIFYCSDNESSSVPDTYTDVSPSDIVVNEDTGNTDIEVKKCDYTINQIA
ncbi:MAG: hypothetical protein N3B13_07050, partial [Deltaproteobacteria bacterium]|nr:hypothetical protein [Deltaproteobacteria bacterium]